jgi:hypothetical protein
MAPRSVESSVNELGDNVGAHIDIENVEKILESRKSKVHFHKKHGKCHRF